MQLTYKEAQMLRNEDQARRKRRPATPREWGSKKLDGTQICEGGWGKQQHVRSVPSHSSSSVSPQFGTERVLRAGTETASGCHELSIHHIKIMQRTGS